VFMFETHPLLFTGKFVFWTNEGINLTIMTLKDTQSFRSDYFYGKLQNEFLMLFAKIKRLLTRNFI
jgi:hypothetical protein